MTGKTKFWRWQQPVMVAIGKKIFLGIFLCGLCVFLVGAAFAAMPDEEFFELCHTGTPQQVEEATKSGADINAETKSGATPLMIAAGWQNNPEVISALINAGAKVNAIDSFGGTPLIFGARLLNPNHGVVSALIKAGADINAKDREDMTPLYGRR